MGTKAFLFLATVSLVVSLCDSYKVVCYYTNWAQYRAQPYAFTPEDIDPSLCTHINYAFAKVVGTNLQGYEGNDDAMITRMMKIKQTNPSVKILLSIGGWTHGTAPFSAVVRSESSMHTFATNALHYLKQRHFDGLDIDWEYPGNRGSPAGDKQKFTRFLQILKDTFAADGLLLTAAVGAGKSTIDSAYEISKISAILDQVNLMAYDLHGSWESTAGENSPLYALNSEHNDQRTQNQDWAVNHWLQNGCPSEKLVLGLGTYGRSMHLSTPSQHEPNARINGPGKAGPILKESGFVAYYEVCMALKAGYTKAWNSEQDVPYAYQGTDWIGYDDPRSFEIKANYIKSKHLGGGMVWAMDLDDFVGTCGQGKWPLMNTLKKILLDSGNSQVTSAPQHHTTGHTTRHTTRPVVTWWPHHTASPTQHQWNTHAPTVHTTRPVVTWWPHHTASPTQHQWNTHAPTVHTTRANSHVATHQPAGQKCRPPIPSRCESDIYPDLCDCHYYYVCDDRGGGKIVFREHKCVAKTVFDVQKHFCNWEDQVGSDACKVSALFGK